MDAMALAAGNWRQVVASIGFHAEAELLYKADAFEFAAGEVDVDVDGTLAAKGRVQAATVSALLGERFRGIACG